MEGFGWGLLAEDAPWAVLKAQVMAMNAGGEVMSEYDETVRALLEAMKKERDAALSVRPAMQEWIDHHYARAEAAGAEVVRLTEELSKSTRWGPPPELPETDTEGRALRARVATMENRVTVAEAEVGRLRAALHSITLSYDERCGIDHATLARSALEAKP